MGVGGQSHAPAALLPGKTRYPFYRRTVGSQGRSERVRKISTPPGFDPRTIQPVASRYTDYANYTIYTKQYTAINYFLIFGSMFNISKIFQTGLQSVCLNELYYCIHRLCGSIIQETYKALFQLQQKDSVI
jgi:hypothetical protein